MNKQKSFSVALIAILSFYLAFPVPPAQALISLTAPSAVLLEPVSERVLYSREPHSKRPPASTTKIVTALVLLDSLPLERWVVITPLATQVEASKLYFKSGDKVQVRDLLEAILMKSANDAAKAIAIEIGGTERHFAELMTQKAGSLGAQNTRFINSTGLPAEGQYTTAYDLALIMGEARKNKLIVSILKQRTAVIRTYYGNQYHFKSHNKMLMRGERVIGKTGWTRHAKYCFVGLIESDSREAIVSVLGSRKLWIDLRNLRNQVTGKDDNILSYGDRGEDVQKLQAALKRSGFFKIHPTGYDGKITKLAVTRFQKSRGFPADGIAGAHTRKALESNL